MAYNYLVIPAKAGIQKGVTYYIYGNWILAFARKTITESVDNYNPVYNIVSAKADCWWRRRPCLRIKFTTAVNPPRLTAKGYGRVVLTVRLRTSSLKPDL